jgi:hypothetical protein
MKTILVVTSLTTGIVMLGTVTYHRWQHGSQELPMPPQVSTPKSDREEIPGQVIVVKTIPIILTPAEPVAATSMIMPEANTIDRMIQREEERSSLNSRLRIKQRQRNICERTGGWKVVTRGGRSWNCAYNKSSPSKKGMKR